MKRDTITIGIVQEEVTRSVRNSSSRKEHGRQNAYEYGLEPIGESSCYAEAVGVHPKLPNVVIKVIDMYGDACGLYLREIYRGNIKHSWAPRVYFYEELGSRIVVGMERLLEFDGYQDEITKIRCILPEVRDSILDESECLAEIRIDTHMGNFMQRENGEVVCTDPFSSMKFIEGKDPQRHMVMEEGHEYPRL